MLDLMADSELSLLCAKEPQEAGHLDSNSEDSRMAPCLLHRQVLAILPSPSFYP